MNYNPLGICPRQTFDCVYNLTCGVGDLDLCLLFLHIFSVLLFAQGPVHVLLNSLNLCRVQLTCREPMA